MPRCIAAGPECHLRAASLLLEGVAVACSMKILLRIALLATAWALTVPAAEETKEESFDAELSALPYPQPVRFLEFKSQGQDLKMAYMDYAPQVRGKKKVVVLLHGKNFGGSYWDATARALAAAGCYVIVPDQIGFGKSSKPAAYQFSFQALAANTKALLDQLGISKCVVVGHSMGGMLAVRLALEQPQLVERLVLVNPIGLEDWKTRIPSKTVDELYAQELKATAETLREYQRQSYFAGQWKPEYEPLIRPALGWLRGPDRARVAWNAALTSDMIWTQPVLYEFPLLRAPTLLIIGQRDRTALGKAWAPKDVAATLGDYPKLGESAAAAIPGAKLVRIADAGHLPQVEAFDAYKTALLDFLASP